MTTMRSEISDLGILVDGDAPAAHVGRALVAAQQAADATLAEARIEAGRIRAEARAEAEEIRRAARAEVADLEQLVAVLRNQIDALSNQVTATIRKRVPTGPLALDAAPNLAAPVDPPPVGRPHVDPPRVDPPRVDSPKVAAPDSVALALQKSASSNLRTWWSAVPLEALLPIVAIAIALLIALALMG